MKKDTKVCSRVHGKLIWRDERQTTVMVIAFCSLVESLLKEGKVGDEFSDSDAEIDAHVLNVRTRTCLLNTVGSK